jgi:hypothetical protein
VKNCHVVGAFQRGISVNGTRDSSIINTTVEGTFPAGVKLANTHEHRRGATFADQRERSLTVWHDTGSSFRSLTVASSTSGPWSTVAMVRSFRAFRWVTLAAMPFWIKSSKNIFFEEAISVIRRMRLAHSLYSFQQCCLGQIPPYVGILRREGQWCHELDVHEQLLENNDIWVRLQQASRPQLMGQQQPHSSLVPLVR